MKNMDFSKIAPFLTNPLVLIGFSLFLLIGLLKQLIKSGIIPEVTKAAGAGIVRLFLDHSFVIVLVVVFLGFLSEGLEKYYEYIINKDTGIKETYSKRADAAFSAVLNELGTNVQTIGTLVSAIESDSLLQPFEKYEKRRVNETELAYRERGKNHYRDYHSYLQELLVKFKISDSTWKAHQNDLLTLNKDISKFISAYKHVNFAVDFIQRYVENVQHTITLNYSDLESYSKITSQRAEKIASAKVELCAIVSKAALLVRKDSELLPFNLGLETAGIVNVPIIRGNDGVKLLTEKSIEFMREKSKVIGNTIPKLNDAAKQHISNVIHDPYLKMMRRSLGMSESLTEAEIYHLTIKKLDTETKEFSKLLTLASTSYFEGDGSNSIAYLERAYAIDELPDNVKKYLEASIHRLKNPDEFGESLGFIIMDIDKKGLFANSGFKLNDILIGINEKPLIEPTDISSSLAHNSNHPFLIKLFRKGQEMKLAVKPGKSAGVTITQLVVFGQVRL
jgi:hypothetical protein